MLQYLSLLDETPASMGGKDNTWRQLTLDGMATIHIYHLLAQEGLVSPPCDHAYCSLGKIIYEFKHCQDRQCFTTWLIICTAEVCRHDYNRKYPHYCCPLPTTKPSYSTLTSSPKLGTQEAFKGVVF